jgi:hypothetical protein
MEHPGGKGAPTGALALMNPSTSTSAASTTATGIMTTSTTGNGNVAGSATGGGGGGSGGSGGDQFRSSSFQLSVRGTPTAFDISPGNEIICVASPGCLGFFHLNGLGSPRHVIHYEQPKQVRSLRYQRTGNLAALRAGIVSLWDTTNSLRPVIGMLQSPGHSILDLQWSSFNHHVLATSVQSCPGGPQANGGIHIWDVRSPSSAVSKFSGLGRTCVTVDWGSHSGNSHLVCGCVDNKRLVVFDSRSSSSGGEPREPYAVVEPRGGIISFCWSKWSDDNLIALSSPSGTVEWWAINTPSPKRVGMIKYVGETPSALLPTPLGKAVVTCSSNKPEASQKLPAAGVGSGKLGFTQFALTLQSFPNHRMGLDGLFPSSNSDDFGEGPAFPLASCAQKILGMKWGTPGRLVPPFHGGFELLLLTASATLHALKVPLEVVRRCCWAVETGLCSTNPLLINESTTLRGVAENSSPRGTTGPGDRRPPHNLLKASARHLVGGGSDRLFGPVSLDRRLTSNVAAHGGNDNVTQISTDEFWATMRAAVLALEEAILHNRIEGVSLGRIDHFARQLVIEVSKPTAGSSSAAAVSGPGQESVGTSVGSTGATAAGSGFDSDANNTTVSLTITFPVEFPASGVPMFTVQGFYNLVSSCSDFLYDVSLILAFPTNRLLAPERVRYQNLLKMN